MPLVYDENDEALELPTDAHNNYFFHVGEEGEFMYMGRHKFLKNNLHSASSALIVYMKVILALHWYAMYKGNLQKSTLKHFK